MSKSLILVPARYNSSRFPGKPLAIINGKPMVQYVCENCKESGFDYAIVTDDERIESAVKSFGGQVVRVDDEVSTGSERIALAFKRFFMNRGYKYIVNVQGDEPLLKSKTIKQIIALHESSQFDVITAVKRRSSVESEFESSNVVKTIFNPSNNACLYFSRSSIPFSRDRKEYDWFQHIGIYSYLPKSLQDFVDSDEGSYESLEKLEQLRLLESGMTIGAIETDLNLIGVDTPDDIHKIEGVL